MGDKEGGVTVMERGEGGGETVMERERGEIPGPICHNGRSWRNNIFIRIHYHVSSSWMCVNGRDQRERDIEGGRE